MLSVRFSNGESLRKLLEAYSDKGIPESAREQIIKEVENNFLTIWNTEGKAIGSNWNNNTLVKTGTLKGYMTGPQGITITNNIISKDNYPPYGDYVNNRYNFMGWTEDAARRIFRIISDERSKSRRR
jgi:hypothetical protein